MRSTVFQALLGLLLIGVLSMQAKTSGILSGRKPEDLFEPFHGDQATLSRDGERFAYLRCDRIRLTVALQPLSPSTRPATLIPLEELPTVRVSTFLWASPTLLVVGTSQGVVYTIDAISLVAQRVLDPTTFADTSGEQPYPRVPRILGLSPQAASSLVIEGTSYRAIEPLEVPEEENTEDDPTASFTATEPASITPSGSLKLDRAQSLEKVVEVFSFDLVTRQLKLLSSIDARGDSQFLYDRTGRPRVRYLRATSTQRFSLIREHASIFRLEQSLDRFLGKGRTAPFSITRDSYLDERSIPLAFGGDPDVLYFASNFAQDGYGISALNMRTKEITPVAEPPEGFDLTDLSQPFSAQSLVLDRSSGQLVGVRQDLRSPKIQWLDTALARIQADVELRLPHRWIELLEWDDARQRFLVKASRPQDPGRLFIYHVSNGRCLEVAKLAPWLTPENTHASVDIEGTTDHGLRITGRLTRPQATVRSQPPLVIWLHDGPWQRTPTSYSRDAQAFADLGCLVLQLDYRGSSGLGRQHRSGVPGAIERLAREDILGALTWLERHGHAFDARRVAVGGDGLGGYLAMRVLAENPNRFRCAVSVNGPTHLRELAQPPLEIQALEKRSQMNRANALTNAMKEPTPGTTLSQLTRSETRAYDFSVELNRHVLASSNELIRGNALATALGKTKKPVLLLHDPSSTRLSIESVRSLQKAIRRAGGETEFHEVQGSSDPSALSSRGAVIARSVEFLAERFYSFDVEIGETKQRN